jgi:hypothetical protein
MKNDYHVLFPFGPYIGKKLQDVPPSELAKLKFGPAYEAWMRIQQRKGVTSLLKGPIPSYIPPFTEYVIPLIIRPKVDPAYFGSYIEYLVKYSLGLRVFGTVELAMSNFGFVPTPSHLSRTGPLETPNKWDRMIFASYKRLIKEGNTSQYLVDILNMSYCHAMEVRHEFDEGAAKILHHYVVHNEETLRTFLRYVVEVLPRLKDVDQYTTDKISVGCIVGEIDVLTSPDSGSIRIVDIKCRQEDNLPEYAKQLFAYFSMHRLRYDDIPIKSLDIWNFMTGKCWSMDVTKITDDICRHHIRDLGSFCPSHVKLLS